jgi:hypothetical protein
MAKVSAAEPAQPMAAVKSPRPTSSMAVVITWVWPWMFRRRWSRRDFGDGMTKADDGRESAESGLDPQANDQLAAVGAERARWSGDPKRTAATTAASVIAGDRGVASKPGYAIPRRGT